MQSNKSRRGDRNIQALQKTFVRRLALLAELGKVLNIVNSGFRDLVNTAAELIVSPRFSIADWCIVDVVESNGLINRVAIKPRDPTKAKLADAVKHCLLPTLTQESKIYPKVTPSLLAEFAGEARQHNILRALDLKSLIVVPFRARGKTIGTLTCLSTVSQRQFTAADLAFAEDIGQRIAVAIENAKAHEKILREDKYKDEFLAVLGHELRNPLASISMSLELLKSHRAQYISEKPLFIARRQVKVMQQLLDDLLDISRIAHGKIKIRKKVIQFASCISRAAEVIKPITKERKIKLSISFPKDPAYIWADPVRIEQIILNLLNNAVKFTGEGGRIWMKLTRDKGEAILSVKDSGMGIEKGFLPYIFDLFVQADTSAAHGRAAGLGIGLALAQALVRQHGGIIEVESGGRGKGTEFIIHFPLARSRMSPHEA